MRFARIVLGGALVAGMLVAGGTSALAECETVWVDAYDVEMQTDRTSYRVGESALIAASVTRTDTGAPVAGADFVAYVMGKRSGFVYTWGTTDADGRALVKLKLKKGEIELGPAKLVGRGWSETAADTACASVVEFGEQQVRNAFVVKR